MPVLLSYPDEKRVGMENVEKRLATPINKLLREQLITIGDLLDFKKELLDGIKRLLEAQATKPVKKWLKSYEVEKLLEISPGTLQTFRNNGTLPYTKIGGTIYYDPVDIEKVLQEKKVVLKRNGFAFRR